MCTLECDVHSIWKFRTHSVYSVKEGGSRLHQRSLQSPDGARVIGVIIARAILNFAIKPLDTPSHGVRVVDVDVVVLPAHWLLHKRFLDLHTCVGQPLSLPSIALLLLYLYIKSLQTKDHASA